MDALNCHPCGMGVCDPSGVGGFLCATSRGFRCAQPPATICHPCGMEAGNPEGCQTVAGGRSNAETSG